MMTSPYHLLCTVATAFQESGQGGKNKEPRTWAMKSGLVPGAHVSRVRPAMRYILAGLELGMLWRGPNGEVGTHRLG